MPQENQVLRCYSCRMFQVHLVKKQKTWLCKMCNSKQSLKQIYGKGSGKDCRLHVMKLNKLQFSGCSINDGVMNDTNEYSEPVCKPATEVLTNQYIKTESKWLAYMDKAGEKSDEEEKVNYEMTESKCFNKKKRKLSKDYDYLKNGTNFKLTEELENETNMNSTSKNNKKHKEQFEEHGVSLYEGCLIESGSKWSAFIGNEKCLSGEEEKGGNKAVFIRKNELCQNRYSFNTLQYQRSFHSEKVLEEDKETCSIKNGYPVNTDSEETAVKTGDEEGRKGNLQICETLLDYNEDDLDEILNI